MNATDAIADAATRAGWEHNLHEAGGFWLVGICVKGDRMLSIRYRLYGGQGALPQDWGVEQAHVKALVDKPPAEIWLTTKIFTGKNKKGQVLAYLKEN